MNELFDRIAALPANVKMAIVGMVALAIPIGYYYTWYSDLTNLKQRNLAAITEAQREKESYEKRKVEFEGFRREVNQLLDDQKELLRVLPKKDDIEQFIENITAQVELSGLQRVTSVREAAKPDGVYLRIPVKMSAVGTYHQINRFFHNVGELKRIVTIEDLQLLPQTSAIADPLLLRAEFTAQTFQFVEGAK